MEFYDVGTIANTHGIKGEVKVMSVTDFPDERFKLGNTLYLFKSDDAEPLELKVASHRVHKGFDLLKFEGYDNINDVEQFKGAKLKVDESQHQPLDDGQYYYDQIIGLDVVTTDGETIGKIKEIIPTNGANDVWSVKRPGKQDLLLPVIDDVVKKVDLDNQLVEVELMEGLDK